MFVLSFLWSPHPVFVPFPFVDCLSDWSHLSLFKLPSGCFPLSVCFVHVCSWCWTLNFFSFCICSCLWIFNLPRLFSFLTLLFWPSPAFACFSLIVHNLLCLNHLHFNQNPFLIFLPLGKTKRWTYWHKNKCQPASVGWHHSLNNATQPYCLLSSGTVEVTIFFHFQRCPQCRDEPPVIHSPHGGATDRVTEQDA